jgi:Fe-Mn family superoxide dismutase
MAYDVPPLPYPADALEPHIDAETMTLHHDKHHQAYVDKLNAALEGTDLAGTPIEDLIAGSRACPRTSGRPCATRAAAT